jgi:hypothetical protein
MRQRRDLLSKRRCDVIIMQAKESPFILLSWDTCFSSLIMEAVFVIECLKCLLSIQFWINDRKIFRDTNPERLPRQEAFCIDKRDDLWPETL